MLWRVCDLYGAVHLFRFICIWSNSSVPRYMYTQSNSPASLYIHWQHFNCFIYMEHFISSTVHVYRAIQLFHCKYVWSNSCVPIIYVQQFICSIIHLYGAILLFHWAVHLFHCTCIWGHSPVSLYMYIKQFICSTIHEYGTNHLLNYICICSKLPVPLYMYVEQFICSTVYVHCICI